MACDFGVVPYGFGAKALIELCNQRDEICSCVCWTMILCREAVPELLQTLAPDLYSAAIHVAQLR